MIDWVMAHRRLKKNEEMSKTRGEEMPKRKADGALDTGVGGGE